MKTYTLSIELKSNNRLVYSRIQDFDSFTEACLELETICNRYISYYHVFIVGRVSSFHKCLRKIDGFCLDLPF